MRALVCNEKELGGGVGGLVEYGIAGFINVHVCGFNDSHIRI